mmetsp:Transcript_2673/g.7089  ORF Transcript_2673/g.7089 Transcript_2673/m.7089 type:complete len:129 (+) Transcript_2673:78-464(+)
MSLVKAEISPVKAEITTFSRRQILAAAIQNCELNPFIYYEYKGSQSKKSTDLVRQVLFAFQKCFCYFFPNDAMMTRYPHNQDTIIDSCKLFRDAVVEQIHELTGIKPRVKEDETKAKDGTPIFLIFYS